METWIFAFAVDRIYQRSVLNVFLHEKQTNYCNGKLKLLTFLNMFLLIVQKKSELSRY